MTYFSQVLNNHEQRYPFRKRELWAVVQSVCYWHCCLYGRTFVLHTELQSLQYLRIQEKLNDRKYAG